MTDYLPREITPRIAEALRSMPVVVLSGLRQTGKSTLLQQESALAAGRDYYTLDEFAVLTAARANPESLLTERVTLDEVQRCPELLLIVKRSVDRQRKAGRFLLSGSANLALLGRVSETLAGRALYLTLQPMSRREIRRATERPPFLRQFLEKPFVPRGEAEPVRDEEVLLGGLPPVCLADPAHAANWFRGYVQTYVERDVRQLSQIADLISFRLLVQLAALRTGQVLKVSELARDAKLNAATTGRYLGLLEASFLLRKLPPYLKNRASRLIKSPKLYVTDSGLAAHLAGVTDDGLAGGEPLRGALVETYVAQNLAAILEAHLPAAALSFWHEQGRFEVDFVIEHGRKALAIEVKAASRWGDRDFAGLRAFLARTPQCIGGVLAYNGATAVSVGDKLWAIPLGHLLS